ncbi:MAG: hypothetical protein IKN87_05055 [Bacilli bacterium]|nr:hypothetical protein [Bacilli bacterium]
MKLSVRKIFSIIIASLTLLLFIMSFAPHIGGYTEGSGWYSVEIKSQNLWDGNKAQPIMYLLAYIGIIAVYLLHIFINLKEKWVQYANYAVGFVGLGYLTMFFAGLDHLGFGLVIGVLLALGINSLSVIWYFMSDKQMGAPVTGYDPKTGKPIYAKPTGFDPKTGKPIFEQK